MVLTLQIERIADTLPTAFTALVNEAQAEGHKSINRLAIEWASNTTRFNHPGETLLAARLGGVLAGIGGLTRDPVMSGALRMRRFYVHSAFRRQGIGRALATALLEQPCLTDQSVTVNAGNSDAHAFWEALGFTPDPRHGHTHIKALRLARVPPAG